MLGQFSTDKLGKRDAVHTPCILVTSNDDLHPGDYVKFVDNETVIMSHSRNYDAVVDPFLLTGANVKNGSFWVLLKPNMTSNLTHYFDVSIYALSHNPPEIQASVKDLEKIKKEAYKKGYDEGYGDADDSDDGCRGCY